MKIDKAWARHIENCYKLTPELWYRISDFQQGRCALCGRVERRTGRRLATDHAHLDGLIRGLLCSQCNPLLGKLENAFIRLGMHKEEGVTLLAVARKIFEYLAHPTAEQALGYKYYGYPGRVNTKKHRKMLRTLKKQDKAKTKRKR